jgi:flagellum-specific peptidoglycan hydrolase FlgJ
MSIEQSFIDQYSEAMVFATQGTPLFPSVKMAQAALETGWGKSTIGGAKNLFGIKATGSYTPYWNGDMVNMSTQENYGSGFTTIRDNFRAYSSVEDSIRDHSHLLMTLSRYAPVREAKTPEDQARALQSAGYATDPGYADKLINIINQYNLSTLDQKKKL